MRSWRLRRATLWRRLPLLIGSLAVALLCLVLVFTVFTGLAKSQSVLTQSELGIWRTFAESKLCSVDDANYAQIFKDLRPWSKGSLDVSYIQNVFDRLPYPSLKALVHVRGGRVVVEGEGASNPKVLYLEAVLDKFASKLRDMSFAITLGDHPMSWHAPLPQDVARGLAAGTLTADAAYRQYGCSGVPAFKTLNKSLHGIFHGLGGVRGLFPVFGAYHIEDCFADILLPVPRHIPDSIKDLVEHSGCPFNGAWETKVPVAYWRGTASGAFYLGSITKDIWSQFHRNRLVAMSEQTPGLVDAAFTGFGGCEDQHCAILNATYTLAPLVDFKHVAAHKYLVAVDGNGAPDSLVPMLCSGSAVLDASLLRHWYSYKLKPWKHVVPVSLDYSNLAERVHWLRQHDDMAKSIAEAAATLINTQLRNVDKECYIYRLMLEYGARFGM